MPTVPAVVRSSSCLHASSCAPKYYKTKGRGLALIWAITSAGPIRLYQQNRPEDFLLHDRHPGIGANDQGRSHTALALPCPLRMQTAFDDVRAVPTRSCQQSLQPLMMLFTDDAGAVLSGRPFRIRRADTGVDW